jgi:hypothetical protein
MNDEQLPPSGVISPHPGDLQAFSGQQTATAGGENIQVFLRMRPLN